MPVKVDGLQGIVKIKAGNGSAFAIDNNNCLWVAGYNGYGNLGDGTTGNKLTFTKLNTLENVADVSASPVNSTIVLLLDGTVWGFGNNRYNALTNAGGAIPQQLQGPDGALKNITSIGTGYYTGYAITSEEKVVAWGLNNYSQLASGDTSSKQTPVYMKDKDGNIIENVMIVAGGNSNTEIAKSNGTVWSIGYNGYGELGDGSTTSTNKLECISTQYIKLNQREVTLKLSNPEYQIKPETVYGFNLLFDIAENNGFTYKSLDNNIATVDEETGKVTANGLGRTYIILKSKDAEDEARVVINVIDDDKKVKEKVEAGNIHSLALKQDGTIWSFGDNSQGEMGNGTISSINTTEPTQIVTGMYTEIKEEETEEGSTQVTTTNIEVKLDNIKDIAAGYNFNLAVDSNGYVYSWGYNGYGQLGDNSTVSRSIPTRIEGLEKIIDQRTGKKAIGFGAEKKEIAKKSRTEVFKELLPQDLLKFGLIPEFVGRLPIVSTLEELDKDALVNILTKPKNALVKQYKKLLAMDGVELEFTPEAVEDKAIERKTGARGLRSIIEEIMRDIMFDIPSNPKIEKCILTKETVVDLAKPEIIINENKEPKRQVVKRRKIQPNEIETA